MYKDRKEAGLVLAGLLKEYKNTESVILAVPRGGVPIAYIIAQQLDLPLEIILTKKIGHPGNLEYAIGAVSLIGSFITPHEDVPEDYVKREVARIRNSLKDMQEKYQAQKRNQPIKGKTLIVVDDGAATGNTLQATVNILRKSSPHKIIIAVPVASEEAIKILSPKADKVICPLIPNCFTSVGAYYKKFEQVTDEEVIYFLEKINTNTQRWGL